MKSAVLTAPRSFQIHNINIPDPLSGEVRIKLEGCGLCGSNMPVWEGRDWFSYPAEPGSPGHEGWGIIDAVGDGVTGLSEGDRVAALTYHAFAEYDIAEADSIVRLPESLSELPFPGEPLACAVNIFKRSRVNKGDTVAVIGIGFMGALLVQLCKSAGAMVLAVSNRPFALRTAQEAGADHIFPSGDYWGVVNKVKEITGGKLCDITIECTGFQQPLDLAGDLVKEMGRLVIAGYHQDGLRSVNMQMWNWKGLDVINAHERHREVYIQGIKDAVKAVTEGKLNPEKLYTHNFNIDDIQPAFETMHTRPPGFLKALIRF